MKRTNLLTLCLTLLVSSSAYSMEREGQNEDSARPSEQAIPLENAGNAANPADQPAPQTPRTPVRRTPLTPLPISREGTPVRQLIPIGNDGRNTPAPEIRAVANTPPIGAMLDTPNIQLLQILEAERRGDITPTEALTQLRILFPHQIPMPGRGSRENTPPNPPRQ